MGWYKPGSWSLWGVPLPEFGATEKAAKAIGGNPSNLLNDQFQNKIAAPIARAVNPGLNVSAKGQVAGITTTDNNNKTIVDNNNNNNNNNQNNNNNGGGSNGGGGNGGNNGGNGDVNNSIDQGAADAQRAAEQAAEAKRQAAQRSYQSKVGEAENTKGLGKQTYDWIIDTLGSNKKDLLESVNMEETQGVEGYDQQKVETQKNYDNSRQEILGTYRDLQREQEKVLRGSGVGQSSRALEATMRLNNLMGKDLSTVSTNEADSLALIGNAVSALKDKSLNLRNKIETDSKSKADQAGLEYQQQINTIDANLNLSANEREDAYAAAESKLADDINSINSWKVNAKLEAEKTVASLKGGVDDFIVDMTNAEGSLNKAIQDKKSGSDQLINQIDNTLLATETGAEQVNQGQYRRPTSKAELDKQLADGAITEAQYQSMVQTLGGAGAGNTMAGGMNTNPMEQDKLLQSLMA